MENAIVSQLLSETDLIDILFHTCDEHNTGRVPVSALITYLEKMTGTSVQHREAVEKLALCLDPEGLNCELDLDTYRRGMHTWIQQLRIQLSDQSTSEPAICFVDETALPSMQNTAGFPFLKGLCEVHTESPPVNDTALQVEFDGVEAGSEMEELRHSNRRLLQENNKLQAQLDSQDDAMAALTHDNTALCDKIRRLQEVVDGQCEVASENEELKSLLSQSQEEIRGLQNRLGQLEKEHGTLQSQLHDSEQKCYKLTSEGEAVNSVIKELRKSVCEQKAALQEAESAQKNLEMELVEREQVLMEVKTSLGEISKLNKELKRSNEELQLHLAQTQQQLARQSLQSRQTSVQMVLSSQDGSESDDENSDDDNIRPLLPFPVPGFSLPRQSSSIHTEIKGMLEEDGSLQCPLSGKEQRETLSDEELLTVTWDMDIQHFLDHLPHITLDSFMAVLMSAGQHKPPHGDRNERSVTAAEAEGDGSSKGELPVDIETSVQNVGSGLWSDSTGGKQRIHHVNERLKQFLQKVRELNEENQRLHEVHKTSVERFLNLEGEALSQVTSADTRVMVLRDILQEERTQNTRLHDQVATLKKILGIVDRKDSMNFDTVKDTLCRQQDKIDHLKRSNLELAEKYHKAELKITDLQEEAQEATLQLEREKHRYSKLEEAVSSSVQARQVDLWDIWTLVHRDREADGNTTQEGTALSSSTEEIKEKILEELQAREKRLKKQLGSVQGRLKSCSPMSLPLHRSVGHGKIRGHCCGYRCTSPSSPLVDALTIDFFNGNYYPPLPKNTRGAWRTSPQTKQEEEEAYMNYLRLSCEDVDCMACRAYRLGVDFHGVASCPTLQLRLAQDLPATAAALGYRDLHSVVTALDYNFNAQPVLSPHLYKHCDPASTPPAAVSDPTAPPTSNCSDSQYSSAGAKTSPVRFCPPPSSASAVHRRLDFRQGTYGRSGTTDSHFSYTSTSQDSSTSTPEFPSRSASMLNSREQPEPASQQYSPAGFRRMSFLAAVDKSRRTDGDWNRRPSYRAAIDPRYLVGESIEHDRPEADNQGGYSDGRAENKTVTFQLGGGGGQSAGDGGRGGGINLTSWSSSSLSSSTDSDSAFWGPGAATSRGSGGQPRKLSVLVEEEDADDPQKTTEKRSSLSSFSSTTPTMPTPHRFNFSNVERRGAEDAHMDFPEGQMSGAPSSVHGSPLCASPPLAGATDVKAMLMATESSAGLGGQVACNADNLPAHFKPRSELPLSSPPPATTSSTSSSSVAPPTSSATLTAATSPSSSSSTSSSSSSVKPVSAVPQSLVLVPGSPPQTPRSSHDNTALPSALPSRLAQLRQTNLAKKREQMKTMKMPELSEHTESSSDSEMPLPPSDPSATSNGAPPPSAPRSSSSPRSPSSSSSPRTKFATTPQVSVTCVDDDGGGGVDGNGEGVEVLKPPAPSGDPVTPSIPESFLKQLGLVATTRSTAIDDKEDQQINGGGEPSPAVSLATCYEEKQALVRNPFAGPAVLLATCYEEKQALVRNPFAGPAVLLATCYEEKRALVRNLFAGVDQLPDKQLESRFNSLALAFKTDRLTLDKRLSIQERSRDIAEQNIDRELQGLRDAVEVLKQRCGDERVQEVITKIQHHLDILEHSVARVSSRAEVFGAVQQEKRMCLAMDVMITYTENIQRLRSTEQSEVEEARRVLNSTRQIGSNFSLDTLSIGDRRSASVCAGLNNPRTGRRRSEVALPRFFGGSGSPSLHISPSMESGFLSELSQSSVGSPSRASFAADSLEEPRQRFQSATANITVRNVVTNTLRRASMERQRSLSSSASFSNPPSVSASAKSDSVNKSQDKEQVTKQQSQEEEAYRHGYEEGLKASLSRELTDLRDQQATISSSLEQVMDRVDSFQEDVDKDHSDIEEAVSRVKDVVVKARMWVSNPNWQSASHLLRVVGAALFLGMALVVAVLTLAPLLPAHISLRNHAKSAQ